MTDPENRWLRTRDVVGDRYDAHYRTANIRRAVLADGCANKEIAARLGISELGVRKHLETLSVDTA